MPPADGPPADRPQLGRSHAPIKSRRRSSGGGGRHNSRESDLLVDSSLKSQPAASPRTNPVGRTSPPGTPDVDTDARFAHGEGGVSGVAARTSARRPMRKPGLGTSWRSQCSEAVSQTYSGLTGAFLRAGSKKRQVVARARRALPSFGAARPLSDPHSERSLGFRRRLCATASSASRRVGESPLPHWACWLACEQAAGSSRRCGDAQMIRGAPRTRPRRCT